MRRYYTAYFDSQLIDSFSTPEEAARAAAISRNITLPEGISFNDLCVPTDLNEWKEIS